MTLYRDMAQRLLSHAGGETDRLLDTRAPRGLGASRYMPLAALRCSTNTRAYPHSRREVVPYSPQRLEEQDEAPTQQGGAAPHAGSLGVIKGVIREGRAWRATLYTLGNPSWR